MSEKADPHPESDNPESDSPESSHPESDAATAPDVSGPDAPAAGTPEAGPPEAGSAPSPVLFADDLELREPHRTLLSRTTLRLAPGEVVVATGRPGSGHTVVALALAGRIVPTSGQVTLGDSQEPRERQAAVALVDVPGVTEPDESIPLHVIVGEELAMARRPARRSAVRDVLERHDLADAEEVRMGEVPPAQRVRLLADLAVSRPGVHHVLLTYPERHGMRPEQVHDLARDLAGRGFGVLVTASPTFPVPDDLHLAQIGRDEEENR